MIGLLLLLLISPTEAPVELLDPRDVVWIEKPSGEDINRVLPHDLTLPGKIVVDCRVTLTGELELCTVVKEEPEGHQFGDMGLKLVNRFRMRLETKSGIPTAGRRIQLKLGFSPAE